MEWMKISIFMILLTILELVIGFLLFLFVTNFKDGFIIFSLLLLFGILAFLFISRFKERKKVEPLEEIFKRYKRLTLLALKIIMGFVLFCLVYVLIFMLLRGKY